MLMAGVQMATYLRCATSYFRRYRFISMCTIAVFAPLIAIPEMVLTPWLAVLDERLSLGVRGTALIVDTIIVGAIMRVHSTFIAMPSSVLGTASLARFVALFVVRGVIIGWIPILLCALSILRFEPGKAVGVVLLMAAQAIVSKILCALVGQRLRHLSRVGRCQLNLDSPLSIYVIYCARISMPRVIVRAMASFVAGAFFTLMFQADRSAYVMPVAMIYGALISCIGVHGLSGELCENRRQGAPILLTEGSSILLYEAVQMVAGLLIALSVILGSYAVLGAWTMGSLLAAGASVSNVARFICVRAAGPVAVGVLCVPREQEVAKCP